MGDSTREAWITGIGIVSCLGEGPDAHWQALSAGHIKVDAKTFAPYLVHPLAPLELDKQIPKKGDQRQMEPWQRIGTYAAGLALADAGVKGNPELLGRTDMIVAAGGGERDVAVDGAILTNRRKAGNPGAFLNERLMSDLRPTLFLAQLSNLLAGNISIVHGVTGSSRTFMGEEAAGVDAVRIALARITSGQSELALVGGSHNGERQDLLLLYDTGGHMLRGAFKPVWEREAGMVLGSLGAFLVLEAREHAQARNAKPLARLSDRSDDLLFSRMLGAPATVACRERASPEGSLNRLSQLHCCGGSWLAPSVDTSREYVPEARVTVRLAARGTGEVLEYPATAAATRSRAARTRRFQTHLGGCRNGSKIRLQIASFTAKEFVCMRRR